MRLSWNPFLLIDKYLKKKVINKMLSTIFIDKRLQSFLERIKTDFSDAKNHEFEIRFSKSGENAIPRDIFADLLQKFKTKYNNILEVF